MQLRTIHRYSALFLGLFVLVHLLNHLVGLSGIEAHTAFMKSARVVYRFPAIEVLLLLAVAIQIYSGLTFVVRGWKQRRGFVAWLQAGSGIYLALFFLNHVAAVLIGRTFLNLETNFHFAAAGFYVYPFQFFFAPYYFLAVLSLFIHLGCAFYWQVESRPLSVRGSALGFPVLIGIVLATVIVLMLAGVFYPVEIPPEYTAVFENVR